LKVRPQDVVMNLRATEVTTHTMTLSWGQPIRLTPTNYKIAYNAHKEFVDAQGITQSAQVMMTQPVKLVNQYQYFYLYLQKYCNQLH
jgi:hypothetical protein